MPTRKPKSRPKLESKKVRDYAIDSIATNPRSQSALIFAQCPVVVMANRGYYRDTIGRLGVNDVGVFDDAAWLIVGLIETNFQVYPFNWNCDPSRIGWNAAIDKFYAQLMPGVWPYRLGHHKGRPGNARQMTKGEARDRALGDVFEDPRADGEFQVRRVESDNVGELQWGYQAINIHDATDTSTGSWGCQTLPPDQHREFMRILYGSIRQSQPWFPLILREDRL